MGQTTDGGRSPLLRALVCTIGISYFNSFVHAETIRVQQTRPQADLATHLGVANTATDGLEAARAPKELNWAGATHAIISCHLAQADCSQFDSDMGTSLSLRADGPPTDAARQERAMTAAALKQRVMSNNINWDFVFSSTIIND